MRSMNVHDMALLTYARNAAENAYCPYSNFPVGAVVETESGPFRGCNIENASYSLGLCAERVAIHSAVAAGARKLSRLAVSCRLAKDTDPSAARMPCGACRQVIAEFMASGSEVIIDGVGVWRVDELIPEAFRLPGAGRETPASSGS